jgi:hypothetical protein
MANEQRERAELRETFRGKGGRKMRIGSLQKPYPKVKKCCEPFYFLTQDFRIAKRYVNLWTIEYAWTFHDYVINYCPFCGKKIKQKPEERK